MRKKLSRFVAVGLTLAMAVGSLAGCGEKKADAVTEETINILFDGAKQEGWDEIYSKFREETKDTLGIELNITWVEPADYKEKLNLTMLGGDEYDLVFDAPWLHLKELAADDYYADLSSYFNSDSYPGLKNAFSSSVMENNKWYGKMCYIPLLRTYGTGIPAVQYRKDWAKEWGIGTNGEITSMDELIKYWDKAKENGTLPLSVTDTRGFYQLLSYDDNLTAAGIQSFAVGGMNVWTYIKDNKIVATAVEGSGDDAFKSFPAPFNYDFGVKRYDTFAQWQNKGYISADSMTCKDAKTPFYAGQSASLIGTLDDAETTIASLKQYSPSAEYGFYVYADRVRNMENGAITTSYSANNGLCIPKSSTKVDQVMKFLNWMFTDSNNHDLFELGIEGTDWKADGTDKYEAISTYPSSFPAYSFTWNPNFVRFSSALPDNVLKYRKWELQESSFQAAPVCGFSFDTSDIDVSTSIAQVKSITSKVSTTKLHGILSDGTTQYDSAKAMIKANVDEAMKNGGETAIAELKKQLEAYLATK